MLVPKGIAKFSTQFAQVRIGRGSPANLAVAFPQGTLAVFFQTGMAKSIKGSREFQQRCLELYFRLQDFVDEAPGQKASQQQKDGYAQDMVLLTFLAFIARGQRLLTQ